MKEGLKIGVAGVRGIVGESFTPLLACQFAQTFGTFIGAGPVLIGRDTRPSGVMVEHAVIAGLQSVGCKAIQLGVVPTPSLLLAVRQRSARGGIMITASHNGPEWNALKFVDARGLFLGPIHSEELLDLYHQQDVPRVGEPDLQPSSFYGEAVPAHLDAIMRYVDGAAIRAAAFSVAVDCCNGVGALHSAPFLRDRLGCQVETLFDQPDGRFRRSPEPLAEHLGALCDRVRQRGCAIGFAQDPDGDRLAVVDEQGRPIGEEVTVALAIRAVLALHEIGPIVANLSAGRIMDAVAAEFGVPVTRTKTGEIHVSEAMLRVGAVAGGEHTGGIIIPAVHPCRDSFVGMAVLLEYLARTGKSVSALVAELPRYALVRHQCAVDVEQAPQIMRQLRLAYEGQPMNFWDGLFIEFDEAWVQVRRSNTEPVLRIIAEAKDEATSRALIEQVKQRAGL
jgi:phosphomannomutase